MSQPNRFATLLLAWSLVFVPLSFAIDFGVSSTSSLGLSSSADFSLSERVDGSFQMPFDQNGGGLDIRANVQTSLLPSPASFSYGLDTATLTFVYQKPEVDLLSVKWTLGRFSLSDPTGLVVNHPVDGTKLVFQFKDAALTLVGGYTGWIPRASSGVTLSLVDQASAAEEFASPRFIGSLEGTTTVFQAHALTVSALAQQDLNPRSSFVPEWSTVFSGEKGGTLDSQYLTLKASGPLVGPVTYDLFGTFGAGSTLSWLEAAGSSTGYQYEYRPILSSLVGGTLWVSVPTFLASTLNVRVLAASGDPDATSTTEGNTEDSSLLFLPITAGSLGTVFNPALSNLIFYEIGANLIPMDSLPLSVDVKLLGFQRAVEGVVNAPGVLRSGGLWLGQELDLGLNYQVLSDLSVSVSGGAFLPAEGTFTPDTPDAGLQYALNTSVNLSF